FHLLVNMLAIMFLGTLFEEKAGTQPVAFIYFISGIGSALIYALVEFGSNSGLVGASGAIFGILGALAILYPREKVRLLFFPYPMSMASVVILFVLFEIFALFTISGDFIAHSGHLGGFLFGVALAKPALSLSKLNSKFKLNLKAKKADIQNLSTLATTPQLKEILQRIEKEDEDAIRLAWIEEFLKKAQCPKCGNKFKIEGKDHAKCTCGLEVYAK
ncbi:MAG: rhomboid family intramembrane serine protease, partial [Thermoplasmata archaeon]